MKTYTRTATLTNVHVDEERGIVTGVNDFGAIVIMTVKQFKDMYAEVLC